MQYFKYRKFVAAYSIVRNMATVKRFYKNTNILSNGDKFEITLDQRKLKTPQGKVFEVNSKALALAVAAEWNAQKGVIDRSNMHLTALCNTVLDNPHNHTKVDMVNYIVNCLEMDTLLFHSNETELYKLQVEKWDPLVQWFCDNYGVDITKTKTIEAPTVSTETKATLLRFLMSYDHSAVYGFMYGVDAIKSVILTLATAERVISVEEAVKLSLLEEGFQTAHWGSVEWHHDHNNSMVQTYSTIFTRMANTFVTMTFSNATTGCRTRTCYGINCASCAYFNVEYATRESSMKRQIMGHKIERTNQCKESVTRPDESWIQQLVQSHYLCHLQRATHPDHFFQPERLPAPKSHVNMM